LQAEGEPALLESQTDAWSQLQKARAGLLLGPPGTGKTFLLSWMAVGYMLACRRDGLPCRVLLTGFTVNSILNLLNACAQKSRYGPSQFDLIYVTSGDEPTVDPSIDVLHLGKTSDQKEIERVLLQDYSIVGGTTWSLMRLISVMGPEELSPFTRPMFDLVCIDEASQMLV